jgi:hypothetical protein
MSSFSKRLRAICGSLGLMGILVPVMIAVIQQVALAAGLDGNPETAGKPYYYGGYPGPPAWFWILVFPGFVAAIVYPLANGWLTNAYKEANAKLRNKG